MNEATTITDPMIVTEELEQRVRERTQQLEEANRELQAFSYSVAHDLRAPLRSIQGFGRILMEEFGAQMPAEAAHHVLRMVGAAERMNTLISDLLTYSQLSQVHLAPVPISLSTVLGDALGQAEGLLQESRGVVEVNHPLPVVLGHRAVLAQVVANLLSNATKFIAPGVVPCVRVWAEASPFSPLMREYATVRLYVEDNGIGIPTVHRERIWGVFERLHGQEEYPGTGIGLAVVRKGVERLGGKVGVEDGSETGSRFWLELARADKQDRFAVHNSEWVR